MAVILLPHRFTPQHRGTRPIESLRQEDMGLKIKGGHVFNTRNTKRGIILLLDVQVGHNTGQSLVTYKRDSALRANLRCLNSLSQLCNCTIRRP